MGRLLDRCEPWAWVGCWTDVSLGASRLPPGASRPGPERKPRLKWGTGWGLPDSSEEEEALGEAGDVKTGTSCLSPRPLIGQATGYCPACDTSIVS
jgi:hypothetical protein